MSSDAKPARRVMFVITGLNWGGAESQVIDLAVSLVQRGWDVSVVCVLPTAVRRAALESRGISVYTLGVSRGAPDPRGLVRFAALIWRIRPQVVHAHMVHASLLARAARLVAPVPVLVTSAHGLREDARWRTIAFRMTDGLSDLTTNVSRAAVRSWLQAGAVRKDRIRFVPNGIDLSRFATNPSARARLRSEMALTDRFVWLAVGRFEEPKDYPNLLSACKLIGEHPGRPAVLIAGDGPLRAQMEQLAAKSGLSPLVRFLGLRADIPELMASADAYVMSSAWEGLPIVLLEAAASGLPIVATNVGGNGEIVENGTTGFLVPPGDSSALAEAMGRMMEIPALARRAMAEAGAAHARSQFDLARVIDEWEALYEQLYRRRGTR